MAQRTARSAVPHVVALASVVALATGGCAFGEVVAPYDSGPHATDASDSAHTIVPDYDSGSSDDAFVPPSNDAASSDPVHSPVVIPGCDSVASGTVIELIPAEPLAPNPFQVDVHMPQPWVYVGLAANGPSGTLHAVQGNVTQTGGEWIWHYTFSASAPGDFCLVFTTDMGNNIRQRLPIRLAGTGTIPQSTPQGTTPPPSCACRAGIDNFCNVPPDTAGCPMTARGGYCDPNGDGSYADGDWTRGYNEFHSACGAGTPPANPGTPPTGGAGLSCGNTQWWNSPTATPYMDNNPTLGHAYWWDTDIAMASHTPVQIRHDSVLLLEGVHPWGWQPTFRDQVTGHTFQFLHLQPDTASRRTTSVGTVYPAGMVVGFSGGDSGPTGLGVYSTGAHLCVQTLDDYRTSFPIGRDTCQ